MISRVTVFLTLVRRGGDGDGYNFLFTGEVAAARDNDVCGVGVAYDSLVAGILFMDLKSGLAFKGTVSISRDSPFKLSTFSVRRTKSTAFFLF
jgi:hypothetical protein